MTPTPTLGHINGLLDRLDFLARQMDTEEYNRSTEVEYHGVRDELLALADKHGGEIAQAVRDAGLPG